MTNLQTTAAGLSEAQRRAVRMSQPGDRLMGGFYNLRFDAPELVEQAGINHPIFGAHYRLTPLGLALRAYLKERGE